MKTIQAIFGDIHGVFFPLPENLGNIVRQPTLIFYDKYPHFSAFSQSTVILLRFYQTCPPSRKIFHKKGGSSGSLQETFLK
jgi:hypothetical protein